MTGDKSRELVSGHRQNCSTFLCPLLAVRRIRWERAVTRGHIGQPTGYQCPVWTFTHAHLQRDHRYALYMHRILSRANQATGYASQHYSVPVQSRDKLRGLYQKGPSVLQPSVLWHCWLGGRKGIRPVKNWGVGSRHGYLSGARCRLAYGPADATASHCLLLQ